MIAPALRSFTQWILARRILVRPRIVSRAGRRSSLLAVGDEALSRVLLVQYESLSTDPAKTMHAIYSFLGTEPGFSAVGGAGGSGADGGAGGAVGGSNTIFNGANGSGSGGSGAIGGGGRGGSPGSGSPGQSAS